MRCGASGHKDVMWIIRENEVMLSKLPIMYIIRVASRVQEYGSQFLLEVEVYNSAVKVLFFLIS